MTTPQGPGINLRASALKEFSEKLDTPSSSLRSQIAWGELMADHYVGSRSSERGLLRELASKIPLTLHSVSLSIGGLEPFHPEYLSELYQVAEEANARWFTDHLCFSDYRGIPLFDLLPLPYTQETVRHMVNRVIQVKEALRIPFGLENASVYAEAPGAEMNEAQFLTEIVEKADCHILLDINNVYVNCANQCFRKKRPIEDAFELAKQFLRSIPLERVLEVHIAGHHESQLAGRKLILDTHGATVTKAVTELLWELDQLHPIQALLLERESNIPPLEEVASEAADLWSQLQKRREVKHE